MMGSVKMQIAFPIYMQIGQCCSLHQTGQTGQLGLAGSKANSKETKTPQSVEDHWFCSWCLFSCECADVFLKPQGSKWKVKQALKCRCWYTFYMRCAAVLQNVLKWSVSERFTWDAQLCYKICWNDAASPHKLRNIRPAPARPAPNFVRLRPCSWNGG